MARRRREKTAMCLPRRWNPPLGGGGEAARRRKYKEAMTHLSCRVTVSFCKKLLNWRCGSRPCLGPPSQNSG